MENIYLIGDTHFNDCNIIQYCNRPFHNVEDMNTVIINNWNSTISDNDIVYILGDFCSENPDEIKNFCDQLNGKKRIVLGNHDSDDSSVYFEAGFECVYNHPIIIFDFLILSHEPQFVQPHGVYANIFAHVHNNPMYLTCSPKSYCVSAERVGYAPIKLNEVVTSMKLL